VLSGSHADDRFVFVVAGELQLHLEDQATAEPLPVDGFAYFPPGDTHRYSCWTAGTLPVQCSKKLPCICWWPNTSLR
jgi:glyoxylate utilization-related uncharacterized protein